MQRGSSNQHIFNHKATELPEGRVHEPDEVNEREKISYMLTQRRPREHNGTKLATKSGEQESELSQLDVMRANDKRTFFLVLWLSVCKRADVIKSQMRPDGDKRR